MNPNRVLDMMRLAVKDSNGDLHIVWEDAGYLKRRIMRTDNTFGPIEPIDQREIDRLARVAIDSGQMELLESIDRDGKHGYDLVPVNQEWPNVVALLEAHST